MPKLFDINEVFNDFWEVLAYLPSTLSLTFFSLVLGLFFGFLIALVRIKEIPVLKQISTFYISIIRGTPIIVQLYVTYFGIPIFLRYLSYWQGTEFKTGDVPSIVFAVGALAFNQAALLSVILQASFEAVNKGEIEAAMAIGMSGPQRLVRIIIPEAIELAIPSLGNTFIGLVKGTSLAFTCGIIEMTAQAKIVASANYRYFEAYVALAIIYWLVTIVIEQIIKLIIYSVKVPDVPKSQRKAKRAKGFWPEFLKSSRILSKSTENSLIKDKILKKPNFGLKEAKI